MNFTGWIILMSPLLIFRILTATPINPTFLNTNLITDLLFFLKIVPSMSLSKGILWVGDILFLHQHYWIIANLFRTRIGRNFIIRLVYYLTHNHFWFVAANWITEIFHSSRFSIRASRNWITNAPLKRANRTSSLRSFRRRFIIQQPLLKTYIHHQPHFVGRQKEYWPHEQVRKMPAWRLLSLQMGGSLRVLSKRKGATKKSRKYLYWNYGNGQVLPT